MRRTRILATLGPASRDDATAAALLAAGTDAVRLNFSHGSTDDHARAVRTIRAAAAAAGRTVGILQDLSGPKLRIGNLAEPVTVQAGDTLGIDQGDHPASKGRVACGVDALFTSVSPGDRLLLDDGRVELQVTESAPGRLTTRVVTGGTLTSHKGINVPGALLQTRALTAKDEADLRAGIAMGVDAVALSFVQRADDVRHARDVAVAAGAPHLPIFAKIEKPSAVEQIDAIVAEADGIMVARGDLGIELPLETVPAVQRRIVAAARRAGKPVILATQVLESMTSASRPTRAEVTDAAHAVDEGVDAVMLAGETAVGRDPVQVVRTLDTILTAAERAGDSRWGEAPREMRAGSPHAAALCEAAVTLAERAGAAAIVALTEHGVTARGLAAFRPPAPVFAVTRQARTAGQLSLVWGVTPVLAETTSRAELHDLLIARGLVARDVVVVFVALRPTIGPHGTNLVQLERV